MDGDPQLTHAPLLAALLGRQASLRFLLAEAERDAPDWVWDSLLRERVFSCADRVASLLALLSGDGAERIIEATDRDLQALAAYIREERRSRGEREEGEEWVWREESE